jgi:uncharacterized phage-associated protein
MIEHKRNMLTDNPAYDGRAVANFVLDHCDLCGRKITNLSLQKVIFFCHAWSLIRLQKPLIRHSFEAWEYGPVLPYLYRSFKKFNRAPISGRAEFTDPRDGEKRVVEYAFDEASKSLLLEIVEFYTRLSPSALVRLSHIEGGPWHSAWYHEGTTNPGMKIDNNNIMMFYSKKQAALSTH